MDPITVTKISIAPVGFAAPAAFSDPADVCGAWVAVRPTDDPKTYLGVYLGDLVIQQAARFNTATGELAIVPAMLGTNPALYIPDLKRIVMGFESWWGTVASEEDLKQITDADISDVWYMRALKEMAAREPEPKEDVSTNP